MNKNASTKGVFAIFAGMFILLATSLLRGDVPARNEAVAPILAQGFGIIGLILIAFGIIRLILIIRRRM